MRPRSVQRLDGGDRHEVLHSLSESIIECDERVGVELGQGDVLGVEGVDPAELVCDVPCDLLKDTVAEQTNPQPAEVAELLVASFLVISPRCTAW